MSLPEPISPLENPCSVIWQGKLYTFTSQAFQSIQLEEGAEWEELSMGESVTGATCVGTKPPNNPDQAGFFVIGGTGGTTGLQKYTYSTGEWATLTPSDAVFQGRLGHSSAYIPELNSILVYAGSRDGDGIPGKETFTIKAFEPYEVLSHDANAPAAVKPILLPWPPADAFMVGTDSEVYWFKPETSWRKSGASLAEPVTDTTSVQGTLIQGSDNSRNLLLFDLAQSPNKVSRVVIQDANGTPVLNSAPVKEKRQTQDNWPEYNSTFAPDVTRTNFNLAQGDDGLIVISGGNDQEPLALFDSLENSWLNSTDFFTINDSETNSESSSSSSASSTSTKTSTSKTSTSTSTTSTTTTLPSTSATTTTTAAAEATTSADLTAQTGDDDGGLASSTILGITLGSIFAFLLFLALLLFLLRRRKLRQEKVAAGQTGRDNGFPPDEKSPRGLQNISSPAGHFRGHRPQASQDSFSSMAILMGRVNQQKSGASGKDSLDVGRQSTSSFHRQFKSNISKPIPQEDTHPILHGGDNGKSYDRAVAVPRVPPSGNPDPQDGTRRSSGWNKYWSGGSALQVLGFGGKRGTVASDQSSRYSQNSNSNPNPRATQDSATVPPLKFEGRANVSRVNSGSPVVTGFPQKVPFGEGVAGKIERPHSRASSGYSSGIPESVNEAWDVDDRDSAWGVRRAPSSAYASSFAFGSGPPPSIPSTDQRPLPSGVSSQPQLAMASQSSDMSWLNLGDTSRR